jgi:hypothetical protein
MLDADWPFTPSWIQSAFENRQIKHLTVGTGNRFIMMSFDDDRRIAIQRLIELNAGSLTSLHLYSSICLGLTLEHICLPQLKNLKIENVRFDQGNGFENLLRPYTRSPLSSLRFDHCFHIPESFVSWFDPASNIWPTLEHLYLRGMRAATGPGDEAWEEATEKERHIYRWGLPGEGVGMWSSTSRLTLEKLCQKRGIK